MDILDLLNKKFKKDIYFRKNNIKNKKYLKKEQK